MRNRREWGLYGWDIIPVTVVAMAGSMILLVPCPAAAQKPESARTPAAMNSEINVETAVVRRQAIRSAAYCAHHVMDELRTYSGRAWASGTRAQFWSCFHGRSGSSYDRPLTHGAVISHIVGSVLNGMNYDIAADDSAYGQNGHQAQCRGWLNLYRAFH